MEMNRLKLSKCMLHESNIDAQTRANNTDPNKTPQNANHLGPVVQSVVSLTNSLRVISLTVLADSI